MEKTEKKNSRRIALPILLILVIAFAIWLIYDNIRISTTELTLQKNTLPQAFSGFVIAHISDLHNNRLGENQERLIEKLEQAQPDIIVITGDLIDSYHTDVDKAMLFIDRAVNISPVYYSTGNHEGRIVESYNELEGKLISAGVHVLHDEYEIIEKDGQSVRLIGLDDDLYYENIVKGSADIDERLTELVEEDGFNILLSHKPESFEQYVSAKVDVAFCGHDHGGQIRIPFIGGVFSPQQGLFPKNTEGCVESGETSMVVSRGLGNSGFAPRVNNARELVIVTLQKPQ